MEIEEVFKRKNCWIVFFGSVILFLIIFLTFFKRLIYLRTFQILFIILIVLISLNITCMVYRIRSIRKLDKKSLFLVPFSSLFGYLSTQLCLVGLCSPSFLLPILASFLPISFTFLSFQISLILLAISILISIISLFSIGCFKKQYKFKVNKSKLVRF